MAIALDREVRLYCRNQLRDARAAVLRDSEGFVEGLFAIERLGALLVGENTSLQRYGKALVNLASGSPLASEIPNQHPGLHCPFKRLYQHLKDARNDAFHQGAYARHLATHVVLTCIVLEDALMNGSDQIVDFGVSSPLCAEPWQPLSLVRQQMLVNSFSFLPIRIDLGTGKEWRVVSDLALARVVRGDNGGRKTRLSTSITDAVREFNLVLPRPQTVLPGTSVASALDGSDGLPVLIVDRNDALLGIVTPFDLL